jgi:hypothetical protein
MMDPLPEFRMGPAALFLSTAVNLFGPFTFQGTTNKRQTGKAWGVVFVCSASSAIYVELADSYLAFRFLLALHRFVCTRGAPARIQSDRGEQLVAASKIVPKGGQHFHGQAERMIGIVKGHFTRILEMRRLLCEELNTVMQEVALIVNMRPLLEFRLWGRGQNGRLSCRSYIGPLHRVAKRLWEIQKIKKEFWE